MKANQGAMMPALQAVFLGLAILLLASLPNQVSGIANYKECLECFYANRTSNYFCQSNRKCLPLKSTQCSANMTIYKDYQCVTGFQDCTNMTFTENSVGSNSQLGFNLDAGKGCYVEIKRLPMGSYGTMQLAFDDPSSIMVFDKQNRNYQSGDVLGMPVSDDGWAPRKVFVVNKGTGKAGFQVTFIGGILTQQCTLSLIASLLSLSYLFFNL